MIISQERYTNRPTDILRHYQWVIYLEISSVSKKIIEKLHWILRLGQNLQHTITEKSLNLLSSTLYNMSFGPATFCLIHSLSNILTKLYYDFVFFCFRMFCCYNSFFNLWGIVTRYILSCERASEIPLIMSFAAPVKIERWLRIFAVQERQLPTTLLVVICGQIIA